MGRLFLQEHFYRFAKYRFAKYQFAKHDSESSPDVCRTTNNQHRQREPTFRSPTESKQ